MALVLVAASCGGTDDPTATGTVIDVVGSLTSVDEFTIRTAEGDDLTFVPAPGIRFHGLGPLGHLRNHLTTGEPVVVFYEVASDGSMMALEVSDD
jgi:hypothetical protein